MRRVISIFLKISMSVLLFYGCNLPINDDIGDLDNEVNSLSIPEGFDFSTSDDVTIIINDNDGYAKYDVYAYTDELYDAGTETFEDESGETITETVYKSEVLEKLIFSGVPVNGVLKQTVNIPKFYDKLYIRRNEHLNFTSSIVDIVDQKVDFNFSANQRSLRTSAVKNVTDYLYAVNGEGQLFQIDPLTGVLTDLSSMPMGSYTCAIDQENKVLYSIGRSSPYPLMKYSIVEDSWETIANIGFGGPRLEYNSNDGLLYFSSGSRLYTFDPSTGSRLDT